MKKVVTFLLIFFIGIIGVSAKDFDQIACNYNLTGYGKVRIEANDYNSNDPEVKIFYTNASGKLVEYTNPTYDFKSSEATTKSLSFFTTGSKRKGFVTNLKNNSMTCPDLYVNNNVLEGLYVELSPLDPTDSGTFELNKSSELLIYDNESRKWKSKEDFFKQDNIESKKPKECSYTIELPNTGREFDILLVTNYEPGTSKETYQFYFNGYKTDIPDFTGDIAINVGNGTGSQVQVSAKQLKQLYSGYGDNCPPKEEIFSYLKKDLLTDGVYGVTTDKEEASENGVNGSYTSAAGKSNLGAGLKNPTKTGFGNTGDSCSSVLGPTLTALVKEAIKWVRIAGAIIAIVNGMLKLIPAIMSKDAEALNKAFRTCITMAIILVFCLLFDWLLGFIGSIFKWDVSCVV